MMPGRTLHRLAARICSANVLERIVEPAIADLQKEWAATRVDASRRAWMLLAGYCAILKVVAICTFTVSITADEERLVLVRTLAWSLALMIAFTGLLILPPLYTFFDHAISRWNAVTLVPQAVGLAIPLGIAFGFALGLSARPTLNASKIMLLGALAASVLNFAILAWGIPAGNQAFREMTLRELRARGYEGPVTGPQKGYNEMTLSELRGQTAHFSADGEPRIARRYAFAFHFRFSLAAATLALVSMLLAVPVNHRGLRVLVAFTVCCAYWVLMFASEMGNRRGYLPVPLGAWLPNVTFIASAMCFASSRSSRLRGSLESAQ